MQQEGSSSKHIGLSSYCLLASVPSGGTAMTDNQFVLIYKSLVLDKTFCLLLSLPDLISPVVI